MKPFSKYSFYRSHKFSKRLFSFLNFKNSKTFFPSSFFSFSRSSSVFVEKRCYFLNSFLFHSLYRSSRQSFSPSPFFSSPSVRRRSFTIPFSSFSSRLISHKFFFSYYLCRFSSLSLVDSRLDSSLLRLLLFYPSSFSKFRYSIKSPFLFYTPSQVRQFINHGHIFVNGQFVSFRSFSLRPSDRLSLHGFLSPQSSVSPSVFGLKRFTEAFFITYKNFHLFSFHRSFFLFHIRPFFLSFGFSQSPFFLWPLFRLFRPSFSDRVLSFLDSDSSFSSPCYSSFSSKSVRLGSSRQSFSLFNKVQFLELELDFFLL